MSNTEIFTPGTRVVATFNRSYTGTVIKAQKTIKVQFDHLNYTTWEKRVDLEVTP